MDREEQLRQIPVREADPSKWPPGVRSLGADEHDALGTDAEGTLYWHGKPVEIRRPLELSRWQAIIGGAAAIATVVAAAVDVLDYFSRP